MMRNLLITLALVSASTIYAQTGAGGIKAYPEGGTGKTSWNAGSIPFAGASAFDEDAKLVWDDANEAFLVGANTLANTNIDLQVSSSGVTRIGAVSDGASGQPSFQGWRSRGVLGTPTAVQDGDILAILQGIGTDSDGDYGSGGYISLYADGAPGAAYVSGGVELGVTNSSGTTKDLQWWRASEVIQYAADFQVARTDFTNIDTSSDILLRVGRNADPGAWTAASDTDAQDIYYRTASGGAHTANNPRGGDIIFIPGAAGAAGSGRAGRFEVQGQIAGPDGSASLPGFTFADDPDTGLFRTINEINITINGTEVAEFQASGLLGIGGDALCELWVEAASDPRIQIVNSTMGDTINDGLYIEMVGSNGTIHNQESGYLRFATNGSERMQIDSSGYVGVGITPKAWHSDFDAFHVGNRLSLCSNNGASDYGGIFWNRYYDGGGTWQSNETAAGGWLAFENDGAFQIGHFASGSSTPVNRFRITASGHIQPGADNTYTMGDASYRWSDIYAASGSVNTSDERDKGPLSPIPPTKAKKVFNALNAYYYKLKDPSDDTKLLPTIHLGFSGQEVKAICDQESFTVGLYTEDDLAGQGRTRIGLRYAEFIPILVSVMKQYEARIAALEAANK